MAVDKYSKKADKIANLYRAAFYLAKGSKDVAMDFLNKSGESFKGIKTESEKDRLFWAEQILDKYVRLKHNLYE